MSEQNIDTDNSTTQSKTITDANQSQHGDNGRPEGAATQNATETSQRLPVQKTYKLFIGGQFPRSESGHYYQAMGTDGRMLGNVCLASRKDLRDAVGAARSAQPAWGGRSAYNRSQILYRAAEMLEGRRVQFEAELVEQGQSQASARREVEAGIDRLIYYAGWADKYQQVFGAVNPVASSHFNFSVPDPTGVVVVLAPEEQPLLALITLIAPVIVGGNTVIALASYKAPLSAITLAEVLATSDLPGGVVNILTGKRSDLNEHLARHMDINAIVYAGEYGDELRDMQNQAAENVKRVIVRNQIDWFSDAAETPYWIMDTQEIKTTWHPIEHIASAGSKY